MTELAEYAEKLTKEQKKKYRRQIWKAMWRGALAVILAMGISGVIKLWLDIPISSFERALIAINVVVLILQNSINILLEAGCELQLIKGRVQKRAAKNIKQQKV